MGHTYQGRQKDDDNGREVICNPKESHKSADHSALHIFDVKEWTLAKGGKPGRTLILKVIRSDPCEKWFQELFVKRSCNLGISIPKQLVSFEEKYLKRCMEQVHVNALRGAPCAVSVNLSPLDMRFVSDPMIEKRGSFDVPKFAIDYPMADGTRDLVSGNEDEGIVGSIMGSNSMMSILSSPLFQRLVISDNDATLRGKKLFEDKKCIPSNCQGSPGRLLMSPSRKVGSETSPLRNQGYKSDFVQRSPISESCAASVSTSSHGMLQCTWDNGILHFAFSLDDQKQLYLANAGKAGVTHEKALDYVYCFHFKANGQKSSDISGIESDLIGKMKVSSSIASCSGNSKVMETEFVLVGTNDNHPSEIHTLSRKSRRNRKLSKVMEMLKAGPSFKPQTPLILGSSNAIPEDVSEDLSETDFISNLELAAIVVRDHLQNEDHPQNKIGGWGLKFLKKIRVKPTVESSDLSVPSECCQCNAGHCSTSMDIIVPAGLHGGPRTKSGGPSSLIERWMSSGHCDCGGWDIGCPLKVLKARPRSEEGWPSSESLGDSKSFDMVAEGPEQGNPTLKMVNIRDGLYFISFKLSSLSALQCFAIAVATIHSKISSLRPKHA